MDFQDKADAKASSVDEVGISSSPDSLNSDRPDVSGVGISTVDDQPIQDSVKDGAPGQSTEKGEGAKDYTLSEADLPAHTQGKEEKTAQPDGEKAGEKTGGKGDEGRFDKHPDWQRMKQERDEALAKAASAEAKLTLVEKGKTPAEMAESLKPEEIEAMKKAPALPYKDITKMSKEELIEWFEDDPVAYEANRFAQFLHETKIILAKEAEQTQAVKTIQSTFDTYEKDNPSFKELWSSGAIEKYMKENPGHNAISAHMMLTKGSEQKTIDERIRQEVDKAVEKVKKDFAAKRNAETIGDGAGGVKPRGAGSELSDTKSQGGLVSALAAKLHRMRNAASG